MKYSTKTYFVIFLVFQIFLGGCMYPIQLVNSKHSLQLSLKITMIWSGYICAVSSKFGTCMEKGDNKCELEHKCVTIFVYLLSIFCHVNI